MYKNIKRAECEGYAVEQEVQSDTIYDLLILGGGCAGLTAGIYGGRAGLKTLIVERQGAGGQAAITSEVANYPGVEPVSGAELADRMLRQAKSFGAEYLMADVIKVEAEGKVKRLFTADRTLHGRVLILATGANPRPLGFQGEEAFRGRGISYCATCDGFFFRNKEVFVIGGGFSAAEEAIYLTRFARKVTVVVRGGSFHCAASLIDRVQAHPHIEVRFHTELLRVFGEQTVQGAVFRDNTTGREYEYRAAEADGALGVFVFVGYQPATALFKNILPLDKQGYVMTNEKTETPLAGVYAAGDLRLKQLRQLVTAAADGAIAATQAEKYLSGQDRSYL